MTMIQITPALSIDERELRMTFVRASGPGGQNVPKLSTAVELRFDVAGSPSLPEPVKTRLLSLAGRRATDEGVLVIDARVHRTQAQNRQEATDRLIDLLRRAARPPTPRRKTRPTAASRRKRIEAKRRRGETKHLRRRPGPPPADEA